MHNRRRHIRQIIRKVTSSSGGSKKIKHKNQYTSTKTLNNKLNSLYMLFHNIWWHLKDYKYNSHTVMDKFFGVKNQDKSD